MSLHEFISGEIDAVRRFMHFWKQSARANQKLFPTDMNPGEWDEQLSLFKSTANLMSDNLTNAIVEHRSAKK